MSNSLDIILRFSSLGDVVLCSSFVEKLHRHNQSHAHGTPTRRIVFATLNNFRDLLGVFHVPPNDVWGMPNSSVQIFFKTLDYLSSQQSKNELRSICVYDLHRVPKSFFFRLATFYFCLRHRIRYTSHKTPKKSLRRWLSVFFKKDLMGKRHVYIEHQKLLFPKSEFCYPKLRKKDFQSPVTNILVAPDSQHWKKKWPVTHWEEFFRLALSALPEVEFTLVGGKDIFPQDFMDNLEEKFGHRFKNRLGQLPLSDLPLIASEHQLTLCGNSAWQHISEAVGVPVISLPGPIIKGFGFSPFLSNSRELEVELNCRPCTRHGGGVCYRTGEDFHACMKRITAEFLIKNVKEMLKL